MSARAKKGDEDRFNPVGEVRPIAPFDFDENRYVFVSHPSGTDPDLLRAIVRSLLRRRVSVWIYKAEACRLTDAEAKGVRVQKNDPTQKWDQQVLDAVDAASQVLLLVGQGSIGNAYQRIEIDRAIELKKFITIRVDDVSPKEMPPALQDDLNECLNPKSDNPDIVADGVRLLADKIAQKVLVEAYRPVPRESTVGRYLRRVPPSVWAATSGVAVVASIGLFFLQGNGYKGSTYVAPPPPDMVIPDALNQTGPRLALVISQSNYANELSRVDSAMSEGDQIEAALHKINFTVFRANDRSKSELQQALDNFRLELGKRDRSAIGFVYYTGHGVQDPDTGDNYLLGIDARLRNKADLATFGIKLTAERDNLDALQKRAIFLVFDACRNTPTGAGFKSGTKGLNRLTPTSDMLVAYSTGIGDVAAEGRYAPALARELIEPNQKADTAFIDARDTVFIASEGKQKPYTESDLTLMCFVSCPKQ